MLEARLELNKMKTLDLSYNLLEKIKIIKCQKLKGLITLKNESVLMKKQFNYGLAILKSYLAFLVVLSHQFSKKTTKNKIILKLTKKMNYHVPCFFIMSFYFMCNNFI